MNHLEAVKGKLAEGYLLGDLTSREPEEYEAHYFACPICAEEMRLGAVFLANLKRVLREEQDLSN